MAKYSWRMWVGTIQTVGCNNTLHAAIDAMVLVSNGGEVRDFYVNGHHMNEEFGLWISGNKVVHDDGEEFVPMNKWYDILEVPGYYTDEDEAA